MTNHPKFTESHDSAARSVGYEGAGEIRCPFCGESDFDLPGLKIHLVRGFCEEFGKVVA